MATSNTPRWWERLYRAAREIEWHWSLLGFLGVGGKVTAVLSGLGGALIALMTGWAIVPALAFGMFLAACATIVVAGARAPRLDPSQRQWTDSHGFLQIPTTPAPVAVGESNEEVAALRNQLQGTRLKVESQKDEILALRKNARQLTEERDGAMREAKDLRVELAPAEGGDLKLMSDPRFAQHSSDVSSELAEFHASRYRDAPRESDINWPEGDTRDDQHDANLLWDNFFSEQHMHREETEAQFRSRFQGRILAVAHEAIRRDLIPRDALAQVTKRYHYAKLLTDIAERAHERTKP